CRSHVARLPHPGDDHAPAAAVEQVERGDEAIVEARDEGLDALGLEAQDALGEGEKAAAIHHALPTRPLSPAAIAWSSPRRRGSSSSRSMFGPSDSGRPSGSVRAGSSCISMNSASTPTATAARARSGTYCRSPPERLPSPPGSWTE